MCGQLIEAVSSRAVAVDSSRQKRRRAGLRPAYPLGHGFRPRPRPANRITITTCVDSRRGRSRDVIPPRTTAVTLHAALTVVPGTVLAGLVVTPELTRAALGGLFGVLPAVPLELLATATVDVVAAPADWFAAIGDGIGGLDLAVLRFGGGGLVLVGGLLVAALSYRRAIGRFERYRTT